MRKKTEIAHRENDSRVIVGFFSCGSFCFVRVCILIFFREGGGQVSLLLFLCSAKTTSLVSAASAENDYPHDRGF